MISKELLSEVLAKPIDRVATGNYHVEFGYKKSVDNLNIHELGHRCKEWAFNNEYIIESYKDFYDKKWHSNIVIYREGDMRDDEIMFTEKTEPEVIFLACKWILKETKDKK